MAGARSSRLATRPLSLWNRNQKIGQLVVCHIVSRGVGGYTVKMAGDDSPAFLECTEALSVRQEVLGRIRGSDRRGYILQPEFAQGSGTRPADRGAITMDYSPYSDVAQTGANAMHSGASVPPTSVPPAPVKCRRVFDLVPPASAAADRVLASELAAKEQFICQIEGGMLTTCIKASSDQNFSRFIMLCYRGRLVGCTYGRRDFLDASSMATSDAARHALSDMELPSSVADLHPVSEEMMLAMASLYVGHSIDCPDADSRRIFDALGQQYVTRRLTGTILLCTADQYAHAVGFLYVHRGSLLGYFDVAEQKLFSGHQEASQRIAQGNVCLQPRILADDSRSLGYSLSMVMRAHPTM